MLISNCKMSKSGKGFLTRLSDPLHQSELDLFTLYHANCDTALI